MRLKKKLSRRMIGPACLVGAASVLAFGIVGPDVLSIYAEDCQNILCIDLSDKHSSGEQGFGVKIQKPDTETDSESAGEFGFNVSRGLTKASEQSYDGDFGFEVSRNLSQASEQDYDGDFGFNVDRGLSKATAQEVAGDFGFDVSKGVGTGDAQKAEVADNFGFEVNKGTGSGDVSKDESEDEFGFNVTGKQNPNKTFSGEQEFSINVGEFLEITAGATNKTDVEMEVDNPSAAGVSQTGATDFKVRGNNANGFGVYAYATEHTDLRSETHGQAGGNDVVIPTVDTKTTLAAMEKNHWGFNINLVSAGDATEFRPITNQANAKYVYTSNKASNGVDLRLTCGTKVDTSIPADTYSTTIVVSAVAPFDVNLIAP